VRLDYESLQCTAGPHRATGDGRAEQLEPLYLMSFTRYPVHLRNALMFGEPLGSIRDDLASAGLKYELDSGLKVFCAPAQYPDVLKIMDDVADQLRPYHVLTSSSCRALVKETVDDLRGSHRVRIKDEKTIGMMRLDGRAFQTQFPSSGAKRNPPLAAPLISSSRGSTTGLNSMASPRSSENRTANSSGSSSTVGKLMSLVDQGSPWSSNTSVKTKDVPFHVGDYDMSFCLESGEHASVQDPDMEGVYSICFTHYPGALRIALEQNPSFQRCDVESQDPGHVRDRPKGTAVLCNADQLEAILSGLKSSRYQHHVIVTETYRYWIFELLRQLRSYHVGLNEAFLFSVPQSGLSRAHSASEGQSM